MTIRETINNLDTMAGELIDEIDEGHSENDIYYELREVLDDLQDKITSAQQDNGWI